MPPASRSHYSERTSSSVSARFAPALEPPSRDAVMVLCYLGRVLISCYFPPNCQFSGRRILRSLSEPKVCQQCVKGARNCAGTGSGVWNTWPEPGYTLSEGHDFGAANWSTRLSVARLSSERARGMSWSVIFAFTVRYFAWPKKNCVVSTLASKWSERVHHRYDTGEFMHEAVCRTALKDVTERFGC